MTAEIGVDVGTEITRTNQYGINHTAMSDEDTWDSGKPAGGDTSGRTFAYRGTYTNRLLTGHRFHPACIG
jgi:plastocyanin